VTYLPLNQLINLTGRVNEHYYLGLVELTMLLLVSEGLVCRFNFPRHEIALICAIQMRPVIEH